jgi:tetratricopeptide (TPR) repeat protein
VFKLFEEKKFIESKELYEKILDSPLTVQEEIQLRYGYSCPLSELGFVEKALEKYFELEDLGKETSNKELISQSIHQRDMVYRQNKEYSKALKKFVEEKNFIQKRSSNNHLFMAANLYEIGYTNLLKNNVKEAYHYLTKRLTVAKEIDDFIMIASA